MNLLILLSLCSLLIIGAHENRTLRGQKSHHIHRRASSYQESAVDRLEEYLFPNRTAVVRRMTDGRRLAISKPPYVAADVKCSFCSKATMPVCWILDGFMVEETYLPLDTSQKETCAVIESLGQRVSKEIFGNGRAFRDTVDCRNIVMQYLCLFYGSDSAQYRNQCLYQESSNNANQNDQKLVAKPPCRSFCVQVATVCANDPTFIQTCNRIPCPAPANTTCTPDPEMGADNIVLAANLNCEVPYYRTPYNAASPAFTLNSALLGVLVMLVALSTW